MALEVASTNDALRVATADVFAQWIDAGAERFGRWGFDRATARVLAITFITSLEGAFVLCRAARNTEALDVAAGAVAAAVRRAQDG